MQICDECTRLHGSILSIPSSNAHVNGPPGSIHETPTAQEFRFDVDPDPAFQNDAYPCGSGSATMQGTFLVIRCFSADSFFIFIFKRCVSHPRLYRRILNISYTLGMKTVHRTRRNSWRSSTNTTSESSASAICSPTGKQNTVHTVHLFLNALFRFPMVKHASCNSFHPFPKLQYVSEGFIHCTF
jgi:hypothetical protein